MTHRNGWRKGRIVHIRIADERDIAGIRRLLDEQNAFHVDQLPGFFQASPTAESRVRSVLESPDADYIVAEEDDEIVGLVELHVRETKDLPFLVRKTYAYIQELIVAAGHRGRGIGTRLMDATRAWAREHGAESLRTSVVPTNDRARAFYAKHGFADIMISLEADL